MSRSKPHKPAHKKTVHTPSQAGPSMGSPMDVSNHPARVNMGPPDPGLDGMDMGLPPGSPMQGGPGI